MTRSIGIKSFFIDYYDHWFESLYNADEIWERRSDYPPYKREAFDMMWDAGMNTPWYQSAYMAKRLINDNVDVVAYSDETGHATVGKYKAKLFDVAEEFPDRLVSGFIHTEGPPTHTRIVHIGKQSVEFTMTSDHEWMSNTGKNIEMGFVQHGGHERHFNYPLYAIDYVAGLAVDLNRCPGLSYTPVQDTIGAEECANLIIDWAQKYDFDGKSRMFR